MEQRAVVTETGRLLILLTIRVPAETRKPVLAIQAPNSIYLPAGVTIDIDGDQKAKLEFQMCDGNGCYAAAPIADDLKQAMFKGLKMNVAFQNLNKREFKVPMSLSSFTDVYNSIQ